jgi:hypothetical protein
MLPLSQIELDALRALGLPAMYVMNKTEFDALGKSVYASLSAQSGVSPTKDDVVRPFAVEILANAKFYAVLNGSAHLSPKFYIDRAMEFSRYILCRSWSIISI